MKAKRLDCFSLVVTFIWLSCLAKPLSDVNGVITACVFIIWYNCVFTVLHVPQFCPHAVKQRALPSGKTLSTQKGHIYRACVNSCQRYNKSFLFLMRDVNRQHWIRMRNMWMMVFLCSKIQSYDSVFHFMAQVWGRHHRASPPFLF